MYEWFVFLCVNNIEAFGESYSLPLVETFHYSILIFVRQMLLDIKPASSDVDDSRIPEVAAKSNKTAEFVNKYVKMSYWAYLWRITRRYILCPESFVIIVLLVIVYNTFVNVPPLWRRAKQKLGIPSRNVYGIYQAGRNSQNSEDLYWPSDPNKFSWEFKSSNVAAYSIQGRRPHMEDRFRIHNNGSKVSLYGIFDGHGGEASIINHFIF